MNERDEQRVIEALRELTGGLTVTEQDTDTAEARLKHRLEPPSPRRRLVVLAAAVAAVLAVGFVISQTIDLNDDAAPVQDPTPSAPTESSSTGEEWTPERIRDEGQPVQMEGFFDVGTDSATSGLDAQLHCVRRSSDHVSTMPANEICSWFNGGEVRHWALEIMQGGRSALFDIEGRPWLRVFDDDSILVQDGPEQGPPRYRLLQADGTAVQLQPVGGLAPAIPGPGIMLIDDLQQYRRGYDIETHPYLVDDRAGTLQQLNVPTGIDWWRRNADGSLWGGSGCHVTWQRADGIFDHHDFNCQDPDQAGDPGWEWDGWDDAWLEPGRMALVEYGHTSDGAFPQIVHVSLDHGASWHRIPIEDGDTLPDLLRQLD